MKAKLKRLHSPDIDIQTYWPEDMQNFSFLLQAMIGPDDSDGEESFDIEVCTPEWLRSQYSSEDIIMGRHLLIVFDYDFDRIKSYISRYCDQCQGENWDEISLKLGRIGRWEFEDYTPA